MVDELAYVMCFMQSAEARDSIVFYFFLKVVGWEQISNVMLLTEQPNILFP